MQRKLTAILSADVVGYSGLMEADETGTLERLKANRSTIFDPHVAIHGGRVFKLLGDGALVEFSSVVAAVNCALAIQEATEKTAMEFSEAKRIRYRIGVNLGDIIIDGDDIYGDGVNVAARIQSLAPVGGVALSKMVRDNVEGKLPCAFEDMGEHSVKNIERPVHVFSVRPAELREPEDRRAEKPRQSSICVLPFANMSGDVEQEYFSDGISEDIITDLSKVSALFVVARNTAFQFKGKSVDVSQIARQLKVNHILEGSVRKAGGRVRISAQLIDGNSGGHVWAERYDRELSDIFALQDEISEAIVAALKLKLLPEERRSITNRGTDNVEAYNLHLMARQQWESGDGGSSSWGDGIIRFSRRATEIDPNYAIAWALLGIGQVTRAWHHGLGYESAIASAERALALDPNLPEAHAAKAQAFAYSGRYEEAIREAEIACRLEPRSNLANNTAGVAYSMAGRPDEAIVYLERACALDETDIYSPTWVLPYYSGRNHRSGLHRAAAIAIDHADKALEHRKGSAQAHSVKGWALAALGQRKEAQEWMDRALLIDPDNVGVRFHIAFALLHYFKDADSAVDMLRPVSRKMSPGWLDLLERSFGALRSHPRFIAMLAEVKERLAAEQAAGRPPA